ncbi:hypothetical protein O7631_17620 [Micromonospora sp. WMMD967]|uniref:hypothetical protein n=1 Tax=Micromonospora sp. WMMD967 TaxID=3016101 RepID=UPI002415BA18|nr:hypothetical protein [Micromonospora sp. WMMD967]MDG4838341.1 hypothetical protein [Micromonospora sp. WMMD967]
MAFCEYSACDRYPDHPNSLAKVIMVSSRAVAVVVTSLLTIAVGVMTEYLGDDPGATALATFGALAIAVAASAVILDRKQRQSATPAPGRAGRNTSLKVPPGSGNMVGSSGTQTVALGGSSIGVSSRHVAVIVGAFIAGFIGVAAIAAAAIFVVAKGGSRDDVIPTASISSAPPVLAVVRADARPEHLIGEEFDDVFPYFLPQRPAEVGAPPEAACKERKDWAWRKGGADYKATWAELTLENTRPSQVSVRDFQIEIVSRVPLPDGMVAICTTGGVDAIRDVGLNVRLDEENPQVMYREVPEGPYKSLPGWELNPGDQESFSLYATLSEPVLVQWRLVAIVISGGATKELIVDDNGQPFRTAGRGAPTCVVAGEDDVGEPTDWSCQPGTGD